MDYKQHIEEINRKTDKEIQDLINQDQCPFQPELMIDAAIGMLHCPLCGEMVMASLGHPRQVPPYTEEELAKLAMEAPAEGN